MNFYSLMQSLARLGVWTIILPFMLIFTIVYATLTSTIYGDDDKKKFATIISLVVAMGVVIPHSIGAYPPGMDVVLIINAALPNVALIAVAIVGLFILLGLFGISLKLDGTPVMTIIVGAAVLAIVYIFASAGGQRWNIPPFLRFLTYPDTQALLIVAVVFFILIKFITASPKTEKSKSGVEKFGDTLREIGGLMKK